MPLEGPGEQRYEDFYTTFGKSITGVLHGFDRIRFRGTRRFLANVRGMLEYLWQRQILLKDFKAFAGNLTAQIRQAAEESASREARPVVYLHHSHMDKEAWAREVAQRDGIRQGLIGVLKSVERCQSYEIGPNRDTKRLETEPLVAKLELRNDDGELCVGPILDHLVRVWSGEQC